MDKMIGGLEALSFAADSIPTMAEKLNRYINELELFNKAYNLVNAKNRDEIISAHILDSVAGAETIRRLAEAQQANGAQTLAEAAASGAAMVACETRIADASPLADTSVTIADIGSGGGLPGIPLAVALPQFQFVLVERMAKRCAFLENVAAVLSLENVRVVQSELELLESGQFDVVTFRAFRPLDAHFASQLLRVTKTGGALVAYKARRDAIEAEMAAISEIVPHYEVISLEVPFLEERERNLVVMTKHSAVCT